MTGAISNSILRIDRVPLPPRPNTRGITATMRQLKRGESFLMPDGARRQTAYKIANDLLIKIATRRDEGGRYRVWRTQ